MHLRGHKMKTEWKKKQLRYKNIFEIGFYMYRNWYSSFGIGEYWAREINIFHFLFHKKMFERERENFFHVRRIESKGDLVFTQQIKLTER